MNRNIESPNNDMKEFGRLISLYAQSRSLGLIPLLILGAIIFGLSSVPSYWCIRLCSRAEVPGWLISVFVIGIGAVALGIFMWVSSKVVGKLHRRVYGKDGEIVMEREKIPIWVWIAYAVGFLGPALLDIADRWAVTISLTSFAVFMIYASRKHKEIVLGIVFGGLCLLEAAGTGAGVPIPFRGVHAWFLTSMTYIVAAGVCTAILVYVYNRAILRRIKGASRFGQQPENSADPEH